MDNDRNPAMALADGGGIGLARRRDDEAACFNELYLLAPVGYFVLGFDSRVLLANRTGAAMLGIARANPGAHRFRTFIAPHLAGDFDRFIGRALNSTEPEQCRLSLRGAAGAEFEAILFASADASGQACRVVLEPCDGKLGALERGEERFRRIFDAAGDYLGTLAPAADPGERPASTEAIWRQANYDDLTGLPNRHMFMDRLRLEVKKADRGGAFLALVFLDLDHFKEVNDQHGHAMGDALLAEAARRIAACVRASDTLARLGGDEFVVILAGIDHVGSVERIGQALVAALARPFEINGERLSVSASAGVALYPPDAGNVADLLARADQAMYASKKAGRNRFSYFTPDLQEAALERQHVAADLRAALATGQFEIVYQPIVCLATGTVRKAEALLRWRHPIRGLLAPAEFIPFAESNGLIVDIGDWVFREAARQVQLWQREIHPAFQVSVNKSPVQFRRDASLYQAWLDYLAELGMQAQSIVIEIAEGVLFEGADKVLERLRQYRAMGLQVALDHFGTGYSSLSHLKRFGIDFLKIDQSFVATLGAENGELALCEAIIAMAHKLGLKVVAEGVETGRQLALLTDAGCDYAQGFAIGHPMAATELEALARAGAVDFFRTTTP
ncbi:EAL domain-containing protein [Massilia sp. R2A-15]|uniref:putative bifunctional diguanylate cyclase/phosphodiesterase n=1 Tax=Massilia sp. R2A-15 TaxID=3064278 RepID=UPI002736072D|nr:EAL domain-containing protein [Massilia sp. R2A-15]WLI91549.1 EAL domain-containing protein [Massilia sp. R2A-15]